MAGTLYSLSFDLDTGLSAGHLSTLDHDFKRMLLITPPPTQTLIQSCKLWFKLKHEIISMIDYHDKIHISLDIIVIIRMASQTRRCKV
jgi:hypothetical protein